MYLEYISGKNFSTSTATIPLSVLFLYWDKNSYLKSLFCLLTSLLLLTVTSNIPSETALHRYSYKKLFWKYAANLQENAHAEVWFIEIKLRHGCSLVNLLHTFRTSFPKNTSGGLLLFPRWSVSAIARKQNVKIKEKKSKQTTRQSSSSLTSTIPMFTEKKRC